MLLHGVWAVNKSKKASVEMDKIIVIVLMFFVMILIILWVQGNFRAVSNPTAQIGQNVTNSSPSVINMINTWNLTG